MAKYLEITGSIWIEGMMRRFTASISDSGEGFDEASCKVHAPLLFSEDKEIFGVDRNHARELALNFLEAMVAGRHLVDLGGAAVSFPDLRQCIKYP